MPLLMSFLLTSEKTARHEEMYQCRFSQVKKLRVHLNTQQAGLCFLSGRPFGRGFSGDEIHRLRRLGREGSS